MGYASEHLEGALIGENGIAAGKDVAAIACVAPHGRETVEGSWVGYRFYLLVDGVFGVVGIYVNVGHLVQTGEVGKEAI